MKRYSVNITDEVEADIRAAFLRIHKQSPQNAALWIQGLYAAIDTLEQMPKRCSLIRENEQFVAEVRRLLYHSHRIIFTINEEDSVVEVHTFRHVAQDDIEP